jgi:uncharacterized protein
MSALPDLLRCPETKQRLRVAPPETLAQLNEKIARGTLRNRAGDAVSMPLSGGLIRADDAVFFPIRDDIPIVLIEESIDLR